MKFRIIFLLLYLLSLRADAQPTKKPIDWGEVFKKTGTELHISGKLFDRFSNKSVDMDALKQESFLYVGKADCPPCRVEIPQLIKLAGDSAAFNFVYITTDDSLTIRNEFASILNKNYQLPANFYVVHFSPGELNRADMGNYGFPQKYFVGKDKIIKTFKMGGLGSGSTAEKIYNEHLKVLSKDNGL